MQNKIQTNQFDQKKLEEQLARLVSIKTLTSDTNKQIEAIEYIESLLSPNAIVEKINNNGNTTLVASTISTKTPDICYLVHVDVVAGRDDQFEMRVEDDIALGRGVSDMKFSIPIGVALLNELVAKHASDNIAGNDAQSFALVVTTDEETGGFKGAQYLAKEYGYAPKVFIVPDGGDDFVFIEKAKGVCSIQITSCGIPAHASQIWQGKNAFEPLIDVCGKLLQCFGKNNKQESMETTLNIGKMSGGISTNQVCPLATVTIDMRFASPETFEGLFAKVTKIITDIDPSLIVEVVSRGDPTSVDVCNPVVKRFIDCVECEAGEKVRIQNAYGASDARHFAKLPAPVLMLKPKGGDIHGEREWIDLDSCMKLYRGFRSFLGL